MLKLASIAAIAVGEALMIFSEVWAAKAAAQVSGPLATVVGKGFIVAALGAFLLVVGYVFGYRAFGNIWIVGVISITAILILEPVLNYGIFRELPTLGAGIGFALGALGFVFAILL